jgi:hypothetical protein
MLEYSGGRIANVMRTAAYSDDMQATLNKPGGFEIGVSAVHGNQIVAEKLLLRPVLKGSFDSLVRRCGHWE